MFWKQSTIKRRVMFYNLAILFFLVALTMIVFNVAVNIYIENTLSSQLTSIADEAENTALKRGPDFFSPRDRRPSELDQPNLPKLNPPPLKEEETAESALIRFYFMLDRSLRQPLSILNANYLLLDDQLNQIQKPADISFNVSDDLVSALNSRLKSGQIANIQKAQRVRLPEGDYLTIIRPVSDKNTFGLSWVIIYSSLQKINQLQVGINLLLLGILFIATLLSALFSSFVSRKIVAPFSTLSAHLNRIAYGNFGEQIELDVDDEMKSLVAHINHMSSALEDYDKAQKTFLQNASHEFRTPLMSIQSYGEGIIHDVVLPKQAAQIIVEESNRMTHLVEDLLYLSRLDAIDDRDLFEKIDLHDIVLEAVERMQLIAENQNIQLMIESTSQPPYTLIGDHDKLSRALCNLISNGCRYAQTKVMIQLERHDNTLCLSVTDDGPGFKMADMPYLFDRFYKGEKGVYGLGLSIVQNIVEKHGGTLTAKNNDQGAHVEISIPLSFTSH